LFASPRTLKILSEWKPLANSSEVQVLLETNGSMFDEKHWAQISNLGEYNLHVAITVMSFEEKAYQYLSGTVLPVQRVKDNLAYVKGLREKGIINYLELATVLQERNFREMPSFVKECLEKYDPDCIRIRSVIPSGAADRNIEWFADVRNPYHPYHKEYLEVIKDPIFKNPKVVTFFGEHVSERGNHPGIRNEVVLKNIDNVLRVENLGLAIKNKMIANGAKTVSIYGIGRIGKIIVKLCHNELPIKRLIDARSFGYCYGGLMVESKDAIKELSEEDLLIVTVSGESAKKIKTSIVEQGFKGKILLIDDVVDTK